MSREEAVRVKLDALLAEHRRLNEQVDDLSRSDRVTTLDVQRLKRQKLAIKDQITALRDRITPDIIA